MFASIISALSFSNIKQGCNDAYQKNQERVDSAGSRHFQFIVDVSRRYGRSVMEHTVLHPLVLYRTNVYIHMHICGNAINDGTNQRRKHSPFHFFMMEG